MFLTTTITLCRRKAGLKIFITEPILRVLLCRLHNLPMVTVLQTFIQIMPVKVLADRAGNTYLKDGFKGVRFAIDAGADIHCVRMGGGSYFS